MTADARLTDACHHPDGHCWHYATQARPGFPPTDLLRCCFCGAGTERRWMTVAGGLAYRHGHAHERTVAS